MFGFGKRRLTDETVGWVVVQVGMLQSWTLQYRKCDLNPDELRMVIRAILTKESVVFKDIDLMAIGFMAIGNTSFDQLIDFRKKLDFDRRIVAFCKDLGLPDKYANPALRPSSGEALNAGPKIPQKNRDARLAENLKALHQVFIFDRTKAIEWASAKIEDESKNPKIRDSSLWIRCYREREQKHAKQSDLYREYRERAFASELDDYLRIQGGVPSVSLEKLPSLYVKSLERVKGI
jgi:hypothetical protein